MLAFDIETTGLPEAGEDVGITCAAAVTDAGDVFVWTGAVMNNDMFAPRMSRLDVAHMVLDLMILGEQHQIVTWNGASFDFKIIYDCLSGIHVSRKMTQHLCANHIDPGFTMFCTRGIMSSLENTSIGFGVKGKSKNMTGLESISAWNESLERQMLVLEYVKNDCAALLRVMNEAIKDGGVKWRTKTGNISFLEFNPLMTVAEAVKLPPANTSWMKEPSHFTPKNERVAWMVE